MTDKDALVEALRNDVCVFEDAQGDFHGIGTLRVEEYEDGRTVLIFVSDEVKVAEDVS